MYTITLTDLLGNKDNLSNKFNVVEMNPLIRAGHVVPVRSFLSFRRSLARSSNLT